MATTTPNFSLSEGTQFNGDGSGNPYAMLMPVGSNDVADPTGFRNIGNAPLDVTFVAQVGQGFYRPGDLPAAELVYDIQPGFSVMFVCYQDVWVPYFDNSTSDLLQSFQIAGYFGGTLNTPIANFDILAGGYELLPFDTIFPTAPYSPEGGVVDPGVNKAFYVTAPGIWQLSMSFDLQGHDSSNSGRTIFVEFYNVQSSSVVGRVAIGIGRDQQDTFFSYTGLIQINEADLYQWIEIQVGGGNEVTGGTLVVSQFFFTYQSELGPLVYEPGPPIIETQPVDQSVLDGQTATYSIKVSGIPAPTFQWQINPAGTWVNAGNGNDATFKFVASLGFNMTLIRCVVTNENGTATSNEVKLFVSPAMSILTDGTPAKSYLWTDLQTPVTTYPFELECWAKPGTPLLPEEVPFGITSSTSASDYCNITLTNTGGMQITRRTLAYGSPDRITVVASGLTGWHKWRVQFLSTTTMQVWQDGVDLGQFTGPAVDVAGGNFDKVNVANLRNVLGQTGQEFVGEVAWCQLKVNGFVEGKWDLQGTGADSNKPSQWLTEVAPVEWPGTSWATFDGTAYIRLPDALRSLVSVNNDWTIEYTISSAADISQILVGCINASNADFFSLAQNTGFSRTYIKYPGSASAASFAIRRPKFTWQTNKVVWDSVGKSQTFTINDDASDGTLNATYSSSGNNWLVLGMSATVNPSVGFQGQMRDVIFRDGAGTIIANYPLAGDANDVSGNGYNAVEVVNVTYDSDLHLPAQLPNFPDPVVP